MNIEIPLQYGRSTKLASYPCICVPLSFLSFIIIIFFSIVDQFLHQRC